MRNVPRASVGKTINPASGPKDPPVINSGPWMFMRMSPKKCNPLTGNPKIDPWKKFQPMCKPMGSHRLRLRNQAKARKYPASKMPRMEARLACGLLMWSSAKIAEEMNTPQWMFSASVRFWR